MSTSGEFTVFLVGSDLLAARNLHRHLSHLYAVKHAACAAVVGDLLQAGDPDVVLCEQYLPDARGVEVLQRMRIEHPHAIRILALSNARRDEMVKAINDAAVYQVVTTPFEPEQLGLIVKRALESRELARIHRYLSREMKFADSVIRRENDKMGEALRQTYRFDTLVFASDAMAQVCDTARKAAATDLPVLLEGETGTGKELMAKAIHLFSQRHQQLFMAQNCGAIAPELLLSELFGHTRGAFSGAVSDRLGLFLAADRGTVFLDEIADIAPPVQVALLRFLQEGEVKPLGSDRTKQCNVRVIAASNRPLRELVAEGRFRRDLYYRLKGFEIAIPPLRERVDDIDVLADFLIAKHGELFGRKPAGIANLARQKLRAYAFPGNVRELENEIRRAVAIVDDGQFITLKHLSADIARAVPRVDVRPGQLVALNGKTLKERVEQLEAALVRAALERHRWNHTRASEELGLSRVGLANKLKRYGIDRLASEVM